MKQVSRPSKERDRSITVGAATLLPTCHPDDTERKGWALPGGGFVEDPMLAYEIAAKMDAAMGGRYR